MKLKLIEFGKTNAQGRKRYKRKPSIKQPNVQTELLVSKNNRDEFKTKIKTAEEGRKWINTFLNLKRFFRN